MKILVVDDEKLLVKGMKFNLENEGYEVMTAYDGAAAVELEKKENFDLIVMDVMMPGLSGSDACMKIREFSDVPVIMLTARSEDSDKLMGFACGADDYVTKPFNILELKARIRALLRRSMNGNQAAQSRQRTPLLTVGDLSLDTEQRVALRDGKTIDLTAKEYDLIELLMKNPRRVYSRESLMDLVWGYSYAGDYRTVDVHIRRLREKLEPDPANPVYIMTKWGVGYYLREKNSPPCDTAAANTDQTPQAQTMWQRLGLGIRKLRGKATLQLKFSLSYILVIAAVLILLNSYPLLVSQNMMVASNQNNLKSTAKVIESAMIGLEKLTVENVQAALEGLDESGAARIMVTNSAGLVLYDTRQGSNAVGEYALYSVVAVALRGQDASYCSYDGTAFLSRVATPVVYHNQIVGAVYAYDYDTEQSELLEAFRHNLLIISLLIALLVAGLSIVLSQMLTRQISGLLQAIRKVREGAYSHRADASGTDEIAQIAAEFNSLTDRLQTTENARRRFVSDASHELKTPLAGIRLLTDSILQTDHMDEETTKEFVTDIGREAERLSRITENLLRLTRLDSGVVQQPYPVAVRPVLERVERMLTMVAQEKGVTVSGAADEDAVALATDDDVHQILYNLMENAIKYSAAEDGFVRAEAHVDGEKVVMTVSDNGIGIPDEDLPHIFDRFYRVDKMRSREVGGTGLGLSIVKDTIENRGGTISAGHGANGVGTVFTVYLPLAERGEEA